MRGFQRLSIKVSGAPLGGHLAGPRAGWEGSEPPSRRRRPSDGRLVHSR